MGGERSSTTRQRISGRNCALCRVLLPEPPRGATGERLCAACDLNRPRHRILMNFMLYGDFWRISFLEADCRTTLPRRLNFTDTDKIVDMARRGHADLTSADRSSMEQGFDSGRGGIWLNLTPEQYRALL